MAMIFLDVAKAFNCIHHERLYNKLESIGCSNRCLKWFRSYLNRTQLVNCMHKKSNIVPVLSGIAQGTVLGPLIFIFYINDIVQEISKCHISMFADDCVLYLSGNNWNTIQATVQNDLDKFINWCKLNGLCINASKTKSMIVSTSIRLKNLDNIRYSKFAKSVLISSNNIIT